MHGALRSPSFQNSSFRTPRTYAHRAATYMWRYSSNRSPQYTYFVGSSVVKLNTAHGIQNTSKGSTPTACAAATVASMLPPSGAVVPVAIIASNAAHFGGFSYAFEGGVRPSGDRSCATAAWKDDTLVTGVPLRSEPHAKAVALNCCRVVRSPARPKMRRLVTPRCCNHEVHDASWLWPELMPTVRGDAPDREVLST